MPLYSYKCANGHEFDELRAMAERATAPCPECEVTAQQRITPVRLDYYNMGVSSSLPTAYDKWAKMQEQRARNEVRREYD